MSDGDTRGGTGGSAGRPAGTDQEDHLAVMARAGLMTHVAELAPPVTAEAMTRFRADAARQASNVMALASGRFALCLPPGRREVTSTIAHRLLPIGAAQDAADRAEGAPAVHGTPRRILPPSLRGQGAPRPAADTGDGAGAGAALLPAAAAPATAAAPTALAAPVSGERRRDADPAAALTRAGGSRRGQRDDWPGEPAGSGPDAGRPAATEQGPTAMEAAPLPAPAETAPDPSALARGQVALAEGLSRLAQFIEAAERRASETAAAQERALTDLAERIEAAAGRSAEGSWSAPANSASANPASANPASAPPASANPASGEPASAEDVSSRSQANGLANGTAEGPTPAAPHSPATGDRAQPGAEAASIAEALAGAEARITGVLVEALGGVEARLSEGVEASHGAQVEGIAEVRCAVEAVSAAQADDSARLSEALATLRLGLRAVNDRLAALEAGSGVAGAPTGERPSAAAGAALTRSGPSVEAGAALGPAPVAGFGRGELHGAVQALLGRLDWLEAGAAAAAERRDAPVWRRSAHALRDEAS